MIQVAAARRFPGSHQRGDAKVKGPWDTWDIFAVAGLALLSVAAWAVHWALVPALWGGVCMWVAFRGAKVAARKIEEHKGN